MQKEQLSALMDGETLDSEVLSALSKDATLQQNWESYHLIRDTMRGDVGEFVHFDIAARVAAAIEKEPFNKAVPLIPEAQPTPERYEKMPFWRKVRPLGCSDYASRRCRLRIPRCHCWGSAL